jgi:hypothetical protein
MRASHLASMLLARQLRLFESREDEFQARRMRSGSSGEGAVDGFRMCARLPLCLRTWHPAPSWGPEWGCPFPATSWLPPVHWEFPVGRVSRMAGGNGAKVASFGHDGGWHFDEPSLPILTAAVASRAAREFPHGRALSEKCREPPRIGIFRCVIRRGINMIGVRARIAPEAQQAQREGARCAEPTGHT